MSFSCYQPKNRLMIGHRGAAGLHPENTMVGFEAAINLGADAIELDVRLAHDHLYVLHDRSLDRTTSGKGELQNSSPEEIEALSAGDNQKIPHLDQVIRQVPMDIGINIEMKGNSCAKPIAQCLRKFPDNNILISSFNHKELDQFRSYSDGCEIAPLFGEWQTNIWEIAQGLSAWSVNLHHEMVTEKRIKTAHEKGFRVLAYTVNNIQLAMELTKIGIDGIFTDYPSPEMKKALSL
ncbi:MAG: glycerophosphoryl diester phosphodiesterase [Gammaproteobacteria bacterium]|nr:glycerophosphoryl diester phosphodiesterase [Gammaproteobacteria bacterium]